uniref:Uncharacterized protein n=1 Tax=Amphimedon queenslandica TaxID=400682 RepID=A0A1X7UL85_AMPQE
MLPLPVINKSTGEGLVSGNYTTQLGYVTSKPTAVVMFHGSSNEQRQSLRQSDSSSLTQEDEKNEVSYYVNRYRGEEISYSWSCLWDEIK